MESSVTATSLFEDIFEVMALNPDNYKFEKVNRVKAIGLTFECELLLDINCEIYHLYDSDKFTLVLASTLHLDGSPADHFSYKPQSQETPSLADGYEYVMHGRMFNVTWCSARNWKKVEKEEKCVNGCGCDGDTHKRMDNFVIIAISFGGLLLRLVGDGRHLTGLTSMPNQWLYLLLKKN